MHGNLAGRQECKPLHYSISNLLLQHYIIQFIQFLPAVKCQVHYYFIIDTLLFNITAQTDVDMRTGQIEIKKSIMAKVTVKIDKTE